MKKIVIQPDQHVFIPGMTGSGKTHTGKVFLSHYNNVVCLDTKGTLDWNEVPQKQLAVVTRLEQLNNVDKPKVIYKPDVDEMDMHHYDQFFKYCYFRGNTIVWVDEVMAVCPSPYTMPFYYKAILTRGRELNVAAWSMTQRPAGIPALVMSEADHYFVYILNMPQDRKKLAESTGCPDFLRKPGKKHDFNFWYFNQNMNTPVLATLPA